MAAPVSIRRSAIAADWFHRKPRVRRGFLGNDPLTGGRKMWTDNEIIGGFVAGVWLGLQLVGYFMPPLW
jgi:hypothetical protein